MAKREKKSYVIRSVTNALNLLEEFKGDRDELGVTKLSYRLNLHIDIKQNIQKMFHLYQDYILRMVRKREIFQGNLFPERFAEINDFKMKRCMRR